MASNNGKSKSKLGQRRAYVTKRTHNGRRPSRLDSRTVTLADVGKLAGVSPSTVSRVVSNTIPVSPKVRETVERAIAELGYVPNRAARNLATSQTDSFGIVISEPVSQWVSDPFIAPLLFGIAEGLSETDIQLILIMASTRRDEERVQRYVQKGHVDGVILVGSHGSDPVLEQLVKSGVPMVFSGRPAIDIDVDYVDADHRNGARTAVNHLIAGGRRRIATIHGTLDMPSSHDKLDGYRDALIASGLPYDPTLVVAGNYNPTVAADAMRALLSQHPDIDGVFAASDNMAAAAISVIRDAGLRIPDDVAIVGYDGTPVAMATRPMLTTISQPIEAMGRAMAQLLLRRIAHPDDPTSHIIFTTELIARDSSGALDQNASRAGAT
ncbi:MAG: LacI family DNA-binding transcriptional regulator [Anaerolineae bacterium]|nr:LacI family DNA-binding transcriptional regulator [Anaerolineae bacterium]